MRDLKIVHVGAGSFAWTGNLLPNIFGTEQLRNSELVMLDLSPEPLELTHRLALKYRDLSGFATKITKTNDQTEAFRDADFVIVTITTGGLRAMEHDLSIPEKYGIFMTVGDTGGPSGLSRALRGVPVFLQMAQAMEKLCPQAWMLNCSNPLCALTRVVNKETSIRALGVCHGVRNRVRLLADFFKVPLDELHFVNTGIDHCAWFTELSVSGRPAREMLLEMGLQDWLTLPPDQAKTDPTFGALYQFRCGLMLSSMVGAAFPAISDRHLCEFFPWFQRGNGIEQYGLERTTVADRIRSATEARARVQRLVSGEDPLPPLVSEKAMDNIAGWMLALCGEMTVEDNLNAPNLGQVPQLPSEALVETRGLLDGAGVHPLTSPLTPQLEALIRPHVLREEWTVEAALEGDFQKALSVLTLDPLLLDLGQARPMLEEMIAATRGWLPQFARA
jgi:alpha-galactosidase